MNWSFGLAFISKAFFFFPIALPVFWLFMQILYFYQDMGKNMNLESNQ